MPLPFISFPDCPGGLLFTAVAGTGAGPYQAYPKTTYVDSTGITHNTNPIALDSLGRAPVWLDGYYDIALYDGQGIWPGALVFTQTNVSSQQNISPQTLQWAPQTGQAVYIDATHFSVPGNQVSTFPVGIAVQATVSGGNIYGTVQAASAGGFPQVTTVTVSWFSTQLNASLSAVATSIVSGGIGGSLPLLPTVPITISTVLTNADLFQTIIIGTIGANITITLPAPTAVPPGSWIRLKNAYTGTAYSVQLIGTVNGLVNPYMFNPDLELFSDGTVWYVRQIPLSTPFVITVSQAFTSADMFRTFILNPAAAIMALTLPAANAVPAGAWIRLRNIYLGAVYTVQIIGTVDGVTSPYMLGLDWELFSDGTLWHARVAHVKSVGIAYSAKNLLSGGARTTWASLQTTLASLGVPAAARAITGIIDVSAAGVICYISPHATGTGALSTGNGVQGGGYAGVASSAPSFFRVELITPQVLYYLVANPGTADITLTGYEL